MPAARPNSDFVKAAAAQAAEELPALLDAILRGESIGPFSERLFALLELELYLKAFLERVVEKGVSRGRIAAALRSVLASKPDSAGARIFLVEVLVAARRLKEAERELAVLFLQGGKAAETSRIEILLKLIERGRYAPALERALLRCVARAADDDRIAIEWLQIFGALMCAGKCRSAFRLGEAMLDKLGGFQSPDQLMWPWWKKARRGVGEERFIARELSRIRSAGKKGGFPHWFSYYRAILSTFLGLDADALTEYRRISALKSPRYSWMHQSFVLVKLGLSDYDGTIEICRHILKHAPGHWWVRCRMGEAHLAKGDSSEGLREFERAQRTDDPAVRREVLTWHGEILLWLGRYEEALERFDEAIGLGARTFVYGWRGAARLKLGEFDGALSDLDRAVELDPNDLEARGWRGEAYRIMGRHAEALREFNPLVGTFTRNIWASFNRALSRDALGDEAGLASDYSAVNRTVVTTFIERKLGFPRDRPLSPVEMRKVMTAGLEWAKGVRRWEQYVQPIWMGSER